MRWSDATWRKEHVVSAITEYTAILFRVTIEAGRPSKVTVEIIDGDGLVLFQYDKLSFHRHIKAALQVWFKSRWIEISPDRCFDRLSARAVKLGLDTVLAKYDAELQRRAKLLKDPARRELRFALAKQVEQIESPLRVATLVERSPRAKTSNRTPRPPLLSFDGPPKVLEPATEPVSRGAYDRLMRDRPARWQAYIYVCEELSKYRERRDSESFQRFLALINSFWNSSHGSGTVTFMHVPGNPDAVAVEIWEYRRIRERVIVDLKGIV